METVNRTSTHRESTTGVLHSVAGSDRSCWLWNQECEPVCSRIPAARQGESILSGFGLHSEDPSRGTALAARIPSLINSDGLRTLDGVAVGLPFFNENILCAISRR